MGGFNPISVSNLINPLGDAFQEANRAIQLLAEAIEELQGEVDELREQVAILIREGAEREAADA